MILNRVPDINDINEASLRIMAYVNHTPVLTCKSINAMTGTEIFFKCENFQKVGAFKSRGACNTVFSLTEEEVKNGVATHSSGNHAQALARAALLRNIPAYIVMPENSLKVKIDAVRNYKGIITFCVPTLEARESTLLEVIKKTNALEVHPYDNYSIIAGQATATKELIEQTPPLDFIIAPVGGGGLLAGTALSAHYFSPNTKVIAAEPENANDAYRSFYEGKFVPSINPDTIADGLRTSLGERNYEIIKKHVNQIITVTEDEIIKAMRLIWERMKIIVEPSSAVVLAVIFKNTEAFKGSRVGVIISGGNADLDNLAWK